MQLTERDVLQRNNVDRDLIPTEALAGQEASFAGYQLAIVGNDDRVHESHLLNAYRQCAEITWVLTVTATPFD